VSRRKICVVTSSRADYSLLYWVMKGIQQADDLELQVAVTGMHLSPEFGLTVNVIEADKFPVDARIEGLVSSDTACGVTKSIGLTTIGFADALDRLRPDMLVILGDRFELLAAAQAALIARVPVAHIAGGDTTEGAYDEAIRHSITKMSHLHFVTNELARRRVLQMGESSACVFNFGSPGVDCIRRMTLMDRPTLERELAFRFRLRNLLVTFHPVTLDSTNSAAHMRQLLDALAGVGSDVGIIFTKPNADNDGRIIRVMLEEFVNSAGGRAVAFESLGPRRYLSLMAQVDAVVGNSSSGLYEAPTFRKPTVNIGDRQKGRLRSVSVIDCPPEAPQIGAAIDRALVLDCSGVVNPYGDGHAADRIVAKLRAVQDPRALLQKRFYDFDVAS
jgi:UDP-hydrolysing UDP-N-acetyl-D-glucosamine 2-epimerase